MTPHWSGGTIRGVWPVNVMAMSTTVHYHNAVQQKVLGITLSAGQQLKLLKSTPPRYLDQI